MGKPGGIETFYCWPGEMMRKPRLDGDEPSYWIAGDGRLLTNNEVVFQPPLIPAALGIIAATAEGETSENP